MNRYQQTTGLLFLSLLTLTSCQQVATSLPAPVEDLGFNTLQVPQGFDFSPTRTLSIQGTLAYPDNRPFSSGQVLVRQGSTVYQTLQTDDRGSLSAAVSVPSSLTEVEIVPVGAGLGDRLYPMAPGNGPMTVILDETPTTPPSSAASGANSGARSITGSRFQYLDTYTFDGPRSGVPVHVNQNLDGTARPRIIPTPDLLSAIDSALPENRPVPLHHPDYLDPAAMTELALTSQAEVWVTFLSEGAGYRNALGYFVYDTANPPSSEDQVPVSDIVIAFPNVSQEGSGGGLRSGDTVQLKNPRRMANADASDDGLFDAGLSVAWVLVANGYQNTNDVNTATRRYYSLTSLNPENHPHDTPEQSYKNRTHVAFLQLPGTDGYLLGFEDLSRDTGDNDFNDALFSVSASPLTSVATSVTLPHPYLPGTTLVKSLKPAPAAGLDSDADGVVDSRDEFPSDPTRASRQVYPAAGTWGTLYYEDRWPQVGDYDFNDFVVEWQYEATFSAQGKAVDLTARFRPLAAGAGYASGFGVALPFPSGSVQSVQSGSSAAPGSTLFAEGGNGIEVSGSQSVLPILDNIHAWFTVQGSADKLVNTVHGGQTRPTTAVIERRVVFTSGSALTASTLGSAPFDPFLVVNVTSEGRGREVHLAGKAATEQASAALLATAAAAGIQNYRTSTGLPWALNLISPTPWTQEQTQISQGFRYFRTWAESGGRDYSDWYQNKSGYRNVKKLYL